MTAFVAVAVVLTLAVLALVLLPLLARDRERQAGSSRNLSIAVLRDQLSDLEDQRKAGLLDSAMFVAEQAELERRALEDGARGSSAAVYRSGRKLVLAAVLGLTMPALVVGLYVKLGAPESLKPQASAEPGSHALTPQQIQAMTDKLAERLQANPDDGEGWLMLGRSYASLRRYPEAAAAFGRASALLPPSASLLADYADIMAMAQGRRLAGEPEKIIARALAVDPRHIKSLALSGSAAFERGDFSAAVQVWRTLLALVPPDSNVALSIGNSIADAERRLAGAAAPAGGPARSAPVAAGSATPAPVAAAGAAAVSGTVALAPELAGKLPANGTLFVFARAVDGSRIPLAMTRVNGAKLPYAFLLDDSLSMTPNARLSSAKTVIIGARVSLGGEALARPGDFEGYSAPVAVGANGVVVTIAGVVK